MDVAKRYRPISYLKSNTADVAKDIAESSSSVVITQNGVGQMQHAAMTLPAHDYWNSSTFLLASFIIPLP